MGRIMNLSTEENNSEYVVGFVTGNEIKLDFADGTKLSITHPNEENIQFWRKQIESELQEVLHPQIISENKKLLASILSMVGSLLSMFVELYFTSALMEESLLQFLISLFCLLANMFYCYYQGHQMNKISSSKDKLKAYKLFFKYQEYFEKRLHLHIEDVYALGYNHMMALAVHNVKSNSNNNEGSSLRLTPSGDNL